MAKYSIEIDINDEASGYEDRFNYVSYGTIIAEGDTLEECLESATVNLVDQDGVDVAEVEADSEQFQHLIEQEFKRINSLKYKAQVLLKKYLKPFKRLTYFERTVLNRKPNLWQKFVHKQ